MKPVVLIIRDGWGEDGDLAHLPYNAVRLAHTPVADQLSQNWPRTLLKTHGLDVGLPAGVMGNSEVGHQNIGAGRIVDQERVRIDKAFEQQTLRDNPVLKEAFESVCRQGALHFIGLCSDAGVHSVLSHLFGLWTLAVQAGVQAIYIHMITDGRDAPPMSGLGFLEQIEAFASECGVGQVASVIGRFWAMDRDCRWERIQQAYDCLVGQGGFARGTSPQAVIQHYYAQPTGGIGDEFMPPTAMVDQQGQPIGRIQDGDSVIFFNFRGDRPRELSQAFLDPACHHFKRINWSNLRYVTLTDYQEGLCSRVIFPKAEKMKDTLGEVISRAGLQQFRCAETEKYPHVTFFFNDYQDEPFPGEKRCLIPSPRDVLTYDLKPRMSANGVTQAAQAAILSGEYALIVVNYANADMVGHTGNLQAAIAACEAVDEGVGVLLQAVDQQDAIAIITADHGNAETMWDVQVQAPHTRHTTHLVECVVYGRDMQEQKLRPQGRLADLAPTVLACLDLPQPSAMTGESLLMRPLH